jgi:hypothetical protein
VTLYNYSVKVVYPLDNNKVKFYKNDYSINYDRLQDDLRNIYWGVDELNGEIVSVKIIKV